MPCSRRRRRCSRRRCLHPLLRLLLPLQPAAWRRLWPSFCLQVAPLKRWLSSCAALSPGSTWQAACCMRGSFGSSWGTWAQAPAACTRLLGRPGGPGRKHLLAPPAPPSRARQHLSVAEHVTHNARALQERETHHVVPLPHAHQLMHGGAQAAAYYQRGIAGAGPHAGAMMGPPDGSKRARTGGLRIGSASARCGLRTNSARSACSALAQGALRLVCC